MVAIANYNNGSGKSQNLISLDNVMRKAAAEASHVSLAIIFHCLHGYAKVDNLNRIVCSTADFVNYVLNFCSRKPWMDKE